MIENLIGQSIEVNDVNVKNRKKNKTSAAKIVPKKYSNTTVKTL